MTVVIGAVDKRTGHKVCIIGADSCVSCDSHHIQTTTSKAFHAMFRTDVAFGCAGSIRLANLLSIDTRMFPCPDDEHSIETYTRRLTEKAPHLKQWEQRKAYVIEHVIPVLKEYARSLEKEYDEFDLVLAIKDTLFRVQRDFSVYEIRDFVTIGCGCETAHGAMMAYTSLRDVGCKNPIDLKDAITHSIEITSKYIYGVDSPSEIIST